MDVAWPRGAQAVDATREELHDLRARCLRYLEAAASAGIEEAFGVLATGHETGAFGPPDAIASAAYLSALAQLSPLDSYRRYADERSDRLNGRDRSRRRFGPENRSRIKS